MSSKAAELLQLLNKQSQFAVHQNKSTKNQEQSAIKKQQPKSITKIIVQNKPNHDSLKNELKSNITLKEQSNKSELSTLKSTQKKQNIKKKLIPDTKIHNQPIQPIIKPIEEEILLLSLPQILDRQKINKIIDASSFQAIEQVMNHSQKNAYESYTKQDNEYLQILFDSNLQKNESSMNKITNLLSHRYDRIQSDLQKGQILIQRERSIATKQQLQFLEQLDLERRLKIKDGQLRLKDDLINDKLNQFDQVETYDSHKRQKQLEEELNKKIIQNKDASSFSLNSQKTKIAKDYIKYMNQERKLLSKRKQERAKRYQVQEAERLNEIREAQSLRDEAKKQQLLAKIEQKRRKRQEEQKQQAQKQQEVKKLLEYYQKKTPLFKKKQKQFQEIFLKQQVKLREQKLNERKENRKSPNFSQIKAHEEMFLSKIMMDKQKREQQFKMILARKSSDEQSPYYKGEIHKRAVEIAREEKLRSFSMLQANRAKISKIKQYGEAIAKNFMPEVSEKKRNELLRLIQIEEMKKKKMKKVFKQVLDDDTNEIKMAEVYQEIPQKNIYQEGNKFFQISKKFIKRKKIDEVSQSSSLNENSETNDEPVTLKILKKFGSNGQKEKKQPNIWQMRSKQLKQIVNANVEDARKFQSIKKHFSNLDNKANQKQKLLKQLDMSIDQHMEQKGMLDQYYLQSIRNKIKLLE